MVQDKTEIVNEFRMENKYLAIIGLEVHFELKTKSKMFCGCRSDYFGQKPNSFCCPVCLGLPGALPVPNKQAVLWCILTGLALNCQVAPLSKFDRKSYFYPDLAKGYQISQYDMPLCVGGELEILSEGKKKKVRIRRVHMEEDTGKLLHTEEGTLVDFNRSGVPLVEVVSEPDLRGPAEAKIFVQKLQQIIRYLGVSDGDMEKGTMRLEPNISLMLASLRQKENQYPDYKVEIKNINSFKFVERAIDYELQRQREILERGDRVVQETRGFDSGKGITIPQRGKEEAKDYRYFPEPDIPPMRWDKTTVERLKSQIPELPDAKAVRFGRQYALSDYIVNLLTASKYTADYFEESVKESQKLKKGTEVKTIANWIINKKIDIEKNSPGQFLQMILKKTSALVMGDEQLKRVIERILAANTKAVSDFKAGRQAALMFLVGQVVKETKGQADAAKIRWLLEQALA